MPSPWRYGIGQDRSLSGGDAASTGLRPFSDSSGPGDWPYTAMAAQLHSAFGSHVALLHSGLTPDERSEQWHRIRGGEARVVVGTRSAVFAPVSDLGLIVVDEEHDSSYKQEETPRYHARRCCGDAREVR